VSSILLKSSLICWRTENKFSCSQAYKERVACSIRVVRSR